ncbi:phage regulatory protein, Rha family [Hafnia alvei ATCC 51873]|uniref:Phage regulatory protein, Rha family n=2 Tax=Hafnia TaxID=568 RepID=G9YA59_HAFAL|nr:phage regulatory protein, Rha family [Hafnia alvei ATCC 51873]
MGLFYICISPRFLRAIKNQEPFGVELEIGQWLSLTALGLPTSGEQALSPKGNSDMKQELVIQEFDFSKMVMAIQGQAFTTSQKIAAYFGKRHDNVLRKIRQVRDECPDEFAQLNFEEADFIDKNGETQPMFKLTKDGYMLVVMGFTGSAATLIKVRYIQAFNWMADQICRWNDMGEQAQHRHALKVAKSEVKARIGSKMMNARKREKKLLAIEFEQILSLTQPKLIFNE